MLSFPKSFLLATLILLSSYLSGQEYQFSTTSKKALKNYKLAESAYLQQDIPETVAYLQKALKADESFVEAWLLLGDAFAESSQNEKAIEAYTKAVAIDPTFFPRANFFLGQLYFQEGAYESALEYFDDYLKMINPGSAAGFEATTALRQAEFALECYTNPSGNEPVNAGKKVNSQFDEYVNFIAPGNQKVMLTRKELLPIPAQYNRPFQEKLYEAFKTDGQWNAPDTIEIEWDEGLSLGGLNISVDGRRMYFTGCNLTIGYGNCDLYYCVKLGDTWLPPTNMGPRVNSQWWDSQPMISADGKYLYYSSRRSGGKGGSDIWMSKRLSNGHWSPPVNLGDSINTSGNEMAPFLHADGKTLYFSSTGHMGMGGADIFISRQDETGRWSRAKNLGYPVNTFTDEINFIASLDATEAWLSSDRPGGQGGVDLYKIELTEPIAPRKVVFVEGIVKDEVTKKPVGALVELTDVTTGLTVDTTSADRLNGNFLIVLQPGQNYAFNISAPGYLFYSENYNLDESWDEYSISKEFYLSPIKTGTSAILENVFFDFDQSDLKAESYAELDRLLALLNQNENLSIQISGHTDNVGGREYNLTLSENRAKAVVDYLTGNGIAAQRLTYKGYGDTAPIASNDSEAGRSKNRRTEITILE